jgi:hypothetical protein
MKEMFAEAREHSSRSERGESADRRRGGKMLTRSGHGGARPGAGRPKGSDSYKAEYAEQALKLCRLGATDAEMAGFFGVAVSTLNAWKIAHLDFFDALKKGIASGHDLAQIAPENELLFCKEEIFLFHDSYASCCSRP